MSTPPPSLILPGVISEYLLFARPLVGMECIKSYLGLNEHEVRAEIAAGGLAWAFDLRASGDKQFLRVLSLSMVCWKGAECKQPEDIEAVVDLILPGASEAVESTALQRGFNVVSGHIRHLLRANKLWLVEDGEPGPGVPALISRASVVDLLRKARKDLLDNLSYNTSAVRRCQRRDERPMAGDRQARCAATKGKRAKAIRKSPAITQPAFAKSGEESLATTF